MKIIIIFKNINRTTELIYIHKNVFPDTVLNFEVKGCMDMLQTCKMGTGYFAAITSCIFFSAANMRMAFSVQVQNNFSKIMHM